MTKNIFISLSAHNLDKNLTIVALADSIDAEEKLLAAGATKVIDPYHIGARQVDMMLRSETAEEVVGEVLFGVEHDLSMVEMPITEDSILLNTPCDLIKIEQHFDVVIIGVKRNQQLTQYDFLLNNQPYSLQKNDTLVLIGSEKAVSALAKAKNSE